MKQQQRNIWLWEGRIYSTVYQPAKDVEEESEENKSGFKPKRQAIYGT